jgi:hypothetical protein
MYSLSALFLFAQGASVGVPLWVAIAAPLITALGTVLVAWLTLRETNRRERERQVHEKKMQSETFKRQSDEAWRVERKQAYTAFFALARAAKAATEQPTTSKDTKDELLEDLREKHATVVLVGETKALFGAAQAYYEICQDFLEGDDQPGPQSDERYKKPEMTSSIVQGMS